jgi:RNA polymerase sigma factor (sigma-70 family)
VGIDAIPPPASGLPARLVLGPALRAQSDGRLVRLVREGYESAFDEIVRRYRRPLDRFAAGIVGGRSEDVTQDSFRKALEALRRGDDEVELRPWLYRIVRNTALNDLRDRPPAAAELADDLIAGGRSAAAEAEERAEVAALIARLRALPENQRAALVMRELEGMSHEEIAAALGISHGAARQAIARGRTAVRSGFGALVPLPLLRALATGADGAAEAVAGAGGAAVGGTALGSGAAMVGGGIGAGALKVGLATVVVAGSLGAGVAIQHHSDGSRSDPPKAGASAPGGPSGDGVRSITSPAIAEVDDSHGPGSGSGPDDGGGRRGHGSGDDRASGRGSSHDGHEDHHGHGGGDDPLPTIAPVQSSSTDHHGRSRGGPGPSGDGTSGSDSSGHGGSDDSGSGDGSGHANGGSGQSGSGSGGDDGSGSSSSTRSGRGSDDVTESVVETATASDSSSSGSGTSGGPGPSATESSASSSSGEESTSSSGSSGGSGSGDGSRSSDDS